MKYIFPRADSSAKKRFASHAFSFVDGEDIFILIQHAKGRRGSDVSDDFVALIQRYVFSRPYAVDFYVPFPQRFLYDGERYAVFRKKFNELRFFCTYKTYHCIYRKLNTLFFCRKSR